jgi:fumarate reductase flavoprotein subunit
VFDQATKSHLETDGSDISLGTFIPYHAPLDRMDAELEQDLTTGTAAKADTVAELAEMIGVPPQALALTIARYNEMVDGGVDDDFYKPAKYLRAISHPPYYAVRMVAGTLVSVGGIKVNGSFQVVGEGTDAPITGVTSFVIGSGWYGGYDGLIDDVQIYNYALSAAEVAYVATDGAGLFESPASAADLNADGEVDFRDLATLAAEWLQDELWP